MKKTEASKTSKLMQWLRSDLCPIGTCAIEVKVVKGKKYYANQLKEHQIRALYLTKYKKLCHKIPDAGYQNPFDIFILKEQPAYVALLVDKSCYILDYEHATKNLDVVDIVKLAKFSCKI